MWNKILGFFAGLASVFAAIFFVLFKQSKLEKKLDEAERRADEAEIENEALKANLEAMQAADKAVVEERKENADLIKKVTGSNKLDAFNACNELLSK